MAEVVLDRVRKVYPQGGHVAIDDASFSVADGERLVLVGPSGCGKSTLLRMIAGLESISSGEMRIGGRVVNELPPKQRDIAMVFQSYALYPHMSVARNLGFALELRGMAKDEIARRVREAADMLELGSLLERKPARRTGACSCAAAAGVPARRTAVQPRRQAARRHARRDRPHPCPHRDHDDLRHP